MVEYKSTLSRHGAMVPKVPAPCLRVGWHCWAAPILQHESPGGRKISAGLVEGKFDAETST